MQMLLRLIVLNGLAGSCLSAFAETATNVGSLGPDSRIRTYLMSDQVSRSLLELGREWDKQLGLQAACTTQYGVRVLPKFIAIWKTINLPTDAVHAVDGIWQYKFGLERCGDVKIYNALVFAKQGSAPVYRPLVPGATIASPQLMSDVMPTLSMKLSFDNKRKGNAECKDVKVFDTGISVPPSALAGGKWEETWEVRSCGSTISEPICFTPKDDGGTSFRMQKCTP